MPPRRTGQSGGSVLTPTSNAAAMPLVGGLAYGDGWGRGRKDCAVTSVLVAVDVDGVVSPVHGPTRWNDDEVAGHLFGPVHVAPSLVRHLDGLGSVPGVECLWLTSWSEEMRSSMPAFPGHGWPSLHPDDAPTLDRAWWKLAALHAWLEGRNGEDAPPAGRIGSVVWLDDDLRHGARRAACRRRLRPVGVELFMVGPRLEVGVTPAEMLQVGEWVKVRVDPPHRCLLDEPWRTSPVAPCACAWDGSLPALRHGDGSEG